MFVADAEEGMPGADDTDAGLADIVVMEAAAKVVGYDRPGTWLQQHHFGIHIGLDESSG